jgi:hypothetical protein
MPPATIGPQRGSKLPDRSKKFPTSSFRAQLLCNAAEGGVQRSLTWTAVAQESEHLAPNGVRAQPHSQITAVTPIAIAAAAMTAVAIQPINLSPSWTGNFPMIFGLAVMCIMAIMTGTATTPLITALQ